MSRFSQPPDRVFSALENRAWLGELVGNIAGADSSGRVHVFIGEDNRPQEMHDVSLVLAPYGRPGRAIGVVGVLIRRNAIVIFMFVELMLNAVNLVFVTFARTLGEVDGQVLVFFVLVVAAAEVVVGLAIIVAIFRRRESANVDDVNLLKW